MKRILFALLMSSAVLFAQDVPWGSSKEALYSSRGVPAHDLGEVCVYNTLFMDVPTMEMFMFKNEGLQARIIEIPVFLLSRTKDALGQIYGLPAMEDSNRVMWRGKIDAVVLSYEQDGRLKLYMFPKSGQ